jgi:hypothetical protein
VGSVLWKAAVSLITALAFLAPAAHAQEMDVARGTATVVDGRDTTTYKIESAAGPFGENATGLITRTFTGPGGNGLAVADVTCLAVSENYAVVIGRVRPEESVNIGYEALLVRIYDGTPELQLDGVSSGANPQSGSEITFTNCAGFLSPFPIRPITAGDFQVVDGSEPPPPPPPPPPVDCADDDDCGDDDEDDDDDDGGDG